MNNNRASRVEYIDILRSIGILAMIISHVGVGGGIDHFFHAWHMPLFFIVSGFFYKNSDDSLGHYVIKRVKCLLVPYFFFGIINSFFCIVMYSYIEPPVTDRFSALRGMFCDNTNLPLIGALWFLTAMFIANIEYYILARKIQNIILLSVIVAVIAIFGNLANSVLSFRLPWAMDTAFVGIGFYHAGRGLRVLSSKAQILNLKPYVWIPIGLVAVVLIFFNDSVNMRTGIYAYIPLFYINAILDTVVLWNLSSTFLNIIKKFGLETLSEGIQSIGRNSIIYLCCNQLIIFIFQKIMLLFSLPTIIERALVLVCTVTILKMLELIFTRTRRIKILFGIN